MTPLSESERYLKAEDRRLISLIQMEKIEQGAHPMINGKNVNEVCDRVREMLADDIVSMAEVRHIAREADRTLEDFSIFLRFGLIQLLGSGVEVGTTLGKNGSYVEFIGWRGSAEEKTERAISMMDAESFDADFSVWLALRSNVDRYES